MSKAVEDALRALREISKPEGKGSGPAASAEILKATAPCGSPHCAGCYEVKPGKRIHPPKPSEEWLEWLARWRPGEKDRTQ